LVLTLVLIDGAGNASSPVVVTLQKDRVAPELLQTTPDPDRTILTEDDDVNSGTDEVDVVFAYDVTGAAEGADCDAEPELCVGLSVAPPPENVPSGAVSAPVQSGSAT